MNRRLGCLLLLLVTTTNAAGADDDLTDNRAALRSMRLELDSTGAALQSMRLALDAVTKENDALSARLRAIEPVPTADPTDATIPGKKHDSSNARRLTDSGATASIDFDGTDLQISSPVAVSGDLAASGAVSGASVTASGAVSGASVAASGTVSGASVTASGTVSGASVTASGALSGAHVTASSSLTSTGAATVGGDLTVSGHIKRSTVIAFSAYSTHSAAVAGVAQLPFNVVKFNLGNAYSTASYVFTAPVAGVYSFSIYACAGGAYSKIEFIIGGAWDGVKSYGSTFYHGQGMTIIRQLSAGHQVYPYVVAGNIYMTDGTPSVSTFSGHLIAAL